MNKLSTASLDFSKSVAIGTGTYGTVEKALWCQTPVAVKIIGQRKWDGNVRGIAEIQKVVNLLWNLRHPHVVQFLGVLTEGDRMLFVTELLGGNLSSYVMNNRPINTSTIVRFAIQIARGMTFLHSEPNVIHGDLKPSNVLLSGMNETAELKIADFGMRKIISSSGGSPMSDGAGTTRYMAPEVIKKLDYDNKVDVFSFAMILYEMVEGTCPFPKSSDTDVEKHVVAGHRPPCEDKRYHPKLKELMKQCWSDDSDKRPSFKEIVLRLEDIKGETKPVWHSYAG